LSKLRLTETSFVATNVLFWNENSWFVKISYIRPGTAYLAFPRWRKLAQMNKSNVVDADAELASDLRYINQVADMILGGLVVEVMRGELTSAAGDLPPGYLSLIQDIETKTTVISGIQSGKAEVALKVEEARRKLSRLPAPMCIQKKSRMLRWGVLAMALSTLLFGVLLAVTVSMIVVGAEYHKILGLGFVMAAPWHLWWTVYRVLRKTTQEDKTKKMAVEITQLQLEVCASRLVSLEEQWQELFVPWRKKMLEIVRQEFAENGGIPPMRFS
jgi:hypothetical protein